jgi:hypothetical protein
MMGRAVSEGIPHDYRVGDVLRVTCPPSPARIGKVTRFYASVIWPWGEIDPDSKYRWNGEVAFPTPDSRESPGLFRTDPEPHHLVAGESCLVGIPETLVGVVDVIRHDPPQDVGWLPRPHTTLAVIPVDIPVDQLAAAEGQEGDLIRLDSFAPISLEVVTRS